MPEAAVMLACALYFFSLGSKNVSIHPDGMHLKDLNIKPWLENLGFRKISQLGTTQAGGFYTRQGNTLEVNPKSGIGDVDGVFENHRIIVEAKGGVTNTRHSGQVSKIRRGFNEALGILILTDCNRNDKKFIAVPRTKQIERFLKPKLELLRQAGINVALISNNGDLEVLE